MRAVVSVTFTPGAGVPCALSTSFETYDSSNGVTHVFLTDMAQMGGHGGGYGR